MSNIFVNLSVDIFFCVIFQPNLMIWNIFFCELASVVIVCIFLVPGINYFISMNNTPSLTSSSQAKGLSWAQGLSSDDINTMHRKFLLTLFFATSKSKKKKLILKSWAPFHLLVWLLKFENYMTKPMIWVFRKPKKWQEDDT